MSLGQPIGRNISQEQDARLFSMGVDIKPQAAKGEARVKQLTVCQVEQGHYKVLPRYWDTPRGASSMLNQQNRKPSQEHDAPLLSIGFYVDAKKAAKKALEEARCIELRGWQGLQGKYNDQNRQGRKDAHSSKTGRGDNMCPAQSLHRENGYCRVLRGDEAYPWLEEAG